MSLLIAALNERFTDFSELQDITNYGCAGGVSGFIYYTELTVFFEEHEDAIIDVLQELGITPSSLVKDEFDWCMDEFRQNAVWIVIEDYAHHKVNNALEAAQEALPAGVS